MTASLAESKSVIVVFGAPHAGIDTLCRAIAGVSRGVHVGDLSLGYADNLRELLQMHELAQNAMHDPLHDFLQQHVAAARQDPAAYLRAHAHYDLRQLLHLLIDHVAAPVTLFSDCGAGFRVHQVERWMRALPQALFVHATTPMEAFAEAAARHYAGRLFIPADFRDHDARLANGGLHFSPDLAWFQLHDSIARAFAGQAGVLRCRIDQTRALAQGHLAIEQLRQLAAAQQRRGELAWPARPAASLDQLKALLGLS